MAAVLLLAVVMVVVSPPRVGAKGTNTITTVGVATKATRSEPPTTQRRGCRSITTTRCDPPCLGDGCRCGGCRRPCKSSSKPPASAAATAAAVAENPEQQPVTRCDLIDPGNCGGSAIIFTALPPSSLQKTMFDRTSALITSLDHR
jgi:hypothetical protein